MVIFTLFVSDTKYPFWANLFPKFKITGSKWILVPNSNMQSSMVILISYVFDQKYPFWANLVQKIKIISLSLYLALRLIQISRIQLWSSRFLFSKRNIFFGQIWSKNWKLFFYREIWTNSNMQNSMAMYSFSILDQK